MFFFANKSKSDIIPFSYLFCNICATKYLSSGSFRQSCSALGMMMKMEGVEAGFCFPCNKCQAGFDSLRQLRKHKCSSQESKELSDESNESNDLLHNKNNPIKAELKRAKREFSSEVQDRRYQCKICGNCTDILRTFVKHRMRHDRQSLKVWSCKLERCEKQFESRKEFKQHRNTEHGADGIINCNHCDFTCAGATNMECHMIKHLDGIYTCQDCDFSCSGKTYLHRHMEKHSDKKTLICQQCGRCYKTDLGLREHMILHDVNQPLKEKLQCTVCEMSYDRPKGFAKHMKKHEEDEAVIGLNIWACVSENCGTQFSMKRLLVKHRTMDHGIKGIFQCDHCDFATSGESLMGRHRVKHSDEKSYICQECGKGYKTDCGLDGHMLWHKGVFPFKCDLCNTKYLTMGRFKLHQKITHNTASNRFICSICGKSCSTKQYLGIHMTKHTGEKKYKCRFSCGMTFRRAGSRCNHELIHKGIKRWKCHMCEKKFTKHDQLKFHIKRHLGQKDYICSSCNLGFIEPSGLRKHKCMQYKHINEIKDRI